MSEIVSANRDYVSAEGAAALAGLSVRTVRRWIADGRLHAVKRGRSFCIAVADLSRLVGHPLGATMDPTTPGPQSRGRHATGPAMAADSEPTALVRELMAELLQATAAAARWRTLAEILLDQLEQTEQQSAGSGTDGTGRHRSDGHDAAVQRPPSVSWRQLLSAAGDPPTESRRLGVRGRARLAPGEQSSS
jgi:excisionase family DNA binding protein